jgi:hypothetical protein
MSHLYRAPASAFLGSAYHCSVPVIKIAKPAPLPSFAHSSRRELIDPKVAGSIALLTKLRESCIDPREHRALSER